MKPSLIYFRVVVFIILAHVISGCMVIPVKRYDSWRSRCNISEEQACLFKPGSSTRRDVIHKLGEPDAITMGERTLVYRREQVVAWWVVFGFEGVAGTGDGGELTDNDLFVAHFDSTGVLTRFGEEKKMPKLIPRLTSYGGDKVLFQNKAFLYPDQDGYRKWWNAVGKQVRGKFMLTDRELIFIEDALLANDAPVKKWPYSKTVSCRMGSSWGQEIIAVKFAGGEQHSFVILGPKGILNDEDATYTAYRIIKARSGRKQNP